MVSEDLSVESGTLNAWTAAQAVRALSNNVPVVANVAELPRDTKSGSVKLQFFDCAVKAVATGEVRSISFFLVETFLSAEAVQRGAAEVQLGPLSFVRIVVVDQRNKPVRSRPSVGIALPQVTVERPVSEDGSVDFLLKSGGPYLVYYQAQPANRVRFEVKPGQMDAGIVLLPLTL